MKLTQTTISGRPEFMASAKWEAIPFEFTADTKAGEEVRVTDGLGNVMYGLAAYDVEIDVNPNGAVIVSGIVSAGKLPKKPANATFPTLIFVD